MARNSPSALIMSRIRSSCESPTMCWAFCYRENLCGISESKELFYDLVIIKGTRLVSEQPSLFLPFFGLLWTKVCAWLFWSHPLLPGATGRHPKRALNFLPLWRQLCIHHFTSSHLCTAAQPETGWGVLQRFAMAHPTTCNCEHHGGERKELSVCGYHPTNSIFCQGKLQWVVAFTILWGTFEVLNRFDTFLKRRIRIRISSFRMLSGGGRRQAATFRGVFKSSGASVSRCLSWKIINQISFKISVQPSLFEN